MARRLLSSALGLVFAAAAVVASAQQADPNRGVRIQAGNTQVEVDVNRPHASSAASQQATSGANVFRSSELIGMDVKNTQGEDLGEIEDLVVDSSQGEVRYAVLSFGGFLDIGNKLFAVPFHAVKLHKNVGDADEYWFVFNIDKERLENAPGFDESNWPDFTSADWNRDIDVFYGQEGAAARTSRDETRAGHESGANLVRASQLIGVDVRNAQNENLGEIEDLVMDAGSGKIRYAALSFGGVLGIGDKLFAVPWNAMQIRRSTDNEQFAVFNIDRQRLETAPGFSQDHWPNFADTRWSEEVDRFYSTDAQRSAQQPSEEVQRR
jgi:sporulation protein YlmC with PRC-barrel domain